MSSTASPVSTPAAAARSRILGAAYLRDYGIVLAFVVLFVVLSFSSPAFLTTTNLLNLLEQNAPIGIMACAGAFVLITGALDLSVGAIFALAAILGSKVGLHASPAEAIAIGILVGGGLGLFNGLLVTVGRVNAFIATITTAVIFAGVSQLVTNGFLISVLDPGFTTLGSGGIGDVGYSILLFAAVALLAAGLLNLTTFGRRVFAVGANPEAARLSGVRVATVRTAVFVLSGLAAGLAGMIVATRTSSASVGMGTSVEFDVIAAMLLGGISVQGGEGAIWRAVIGVLILAMIDNGLTLLNVSPTYQDLVKGAIILAALMLDARARRAVRA